MIGDGTLFIRGDETETSWQLITPVLEHWQAQRREGLDELSRRFVGSEVGRRAARAATDTNGESHERGDAKREVGHGSKAAQGSRTSAGSECQKITRFPTAWGHLGLLGARCF